MQIHAIVELEERTLTLTVGTREGSQNPRIGGRAGTRLRRDGKEPMTTCERSGGFTLLELVVVLAVLGLLLGTAAPLAGAVIQADRRQEAQRELAEMTAALEAYYYQTGTFPATLVAAGFLGVHLHPGVRDTVVLDPFGAGWHYVYSFTAVPNRATVYSRGENGVDNGALAEEHVSFVFGAVPGTKKTCARMRVIVEALAHHIEAGGSVAGTWPVVRAAIGLGAAYDNDGFGTALQWTAATHTLSSAGPDRYLGNTDDITL